MDYNPQSCDSNTITKREASKRDNIQSSNLVYTSLLRVCEEADANYFDVQSTAVATKGDFSLLLNEQMQTTQSKIMDANLDDIEMNDELLDKLVAVLLQENLFDPTLHCGYANPSAPPTPSSNHLAHETNSITISKDDTLRIWQKLIDDDGIADELGKEFSNRKTSRNQLINLELDTTKLPTASTPQEMPGRTPNRTFRRHRVTAIQPTTNAIEPDASTPPPSTAPPKTASKKASSKSKTPASSTTFDCQRRTRSSCASVASRTRSRQPMTTTPPLRTERRLRGPPHSTGRRTTAKRRADRSPARRTRLRPKVLDSEDASAVHRYSTRAHTVDATTVESPAKYAPKLAVVIRRARMSMIARGRYSRSSFQMRSGERSAGSKR